MSAMPPPTTTRFQSLVKKPKGKKAKRRLKTAKELAIPLVIQTHGMELQYARGQIEMDPKATDPDNPNRYVSRSRRSPNYTKINIDEFQREAADRYCIQYERMGHARWTSGDLSGGGTAFWDRKPASEEQLEAVKSVRGVEGAIGRQGTILMRLFLLDDLPVAMLAARSKVNAHQMTGMVKMCLTNMIEFWQIDKDISGPPSRIR